MELQQNIARQLRAVYKGGSWTGTNLKDHIEGVTWQQATHQIDKFNTIATLVFHMNYYTAGVIQFLKGKPLEIRDKFSFDHPPISSEADWNNFLEQVYNDCEQLALLIEKLPLEKMWAQFYEEKYGNYYRNLTGIIEHFHYHLGQIIMLKRRIQV